MTKKRKLSNKDGRSTLPVEVINGSLKTNPICLHGPTLLFSNEKGCFYACSLSRNNRDCTFHIPCTDWDSLSVKNLNKKYKELIPKIQKTTLQTLLNKLKKEPANHRSYCFNCDELYCNIETKHHNDHRIKTPLTDHELSQPSTWLPALDHDKVEAQYLFSQNSISVIVDMLKTNRLSKAICIGTPSIHEVLIETEDITSILLDFDKRHAQFHSPEHFIWYNMFNNFMFNGESDEKLLEEFLKGDCPPCIIIDPPFGGRVEPLVQTLLELSKSFSDINNKELKLMSVIWAFPYFSEPYITNMLPELKMHDYQVDYENHKKFHSKNSKARKFGSPVRLFTNLPFSSIDLSTNSNYKYCSLCQSWVAMSNNHCKKCFRCTSKNGMSYKHCDLCERCVKPTFFHCESCKRCCQIRDHVCGVVLATQQSCYNCNEKGHKKSDCPQLVKEKHMAKSSLKKKKK